MSSQIEDAFNEAMERRASGYEQRIAALDDLVQRAWSLIAGAMSGNPHKPTANSEWMDAARRWEIDFCMGQGSSVPEYPTVSYRVRDRDSDYKAMCHEDRDHAELLLKAWLADGRDAVVERRHVFDGGWSPVERPFFTEQQERALARCEGYDEGYAASPDERLREVLREIVRQVEEYPALSPTGIMVRDDIAGMVEGTARAALAASPDERLREAATAIEGLLRNIATPDRPVVASESDRATDVAFARRVLARLAAADCKVRETSMEHERLEQQTLRLRGKLSAIAQTIGLELGGGEDGYLVPAVERLVEGVAERDQAITAALSAMSASQYVDGGITEREAWQRAGELLEPYRIKQQGTA